MERYIGIAALVALILIVMAVKLNLITFLRLHVHRIKGVVLTDEHKVQDLLELHGMYLVREEGKSPFKNERTLVEAYYDCFGRAVILRVSWVSGDYYYMSPVWLKEVTAE